MVVAAAAPVVSTTLPRSSRAVTRTGTRPASLDGKASSRASTKVSSRQERVPLAAVARLPQ